MNYFIGSRKKDLQWRFPCYKGGHTQKTGSINQFPFVGEYGQRSQKLKSYRL